MKLSEAKTDDRDFRVGDKVYIATCDIREEERPCHECDGSGSVILKSALASYDQACPVCCGPWSEVRGWWLEMVCKPKVFRSSIGSVERRETEEGIEWRIMVLETGVGAGRCWMGEHVFYDEKVAWQAAERLCQKQRDSRSENRKRDREQRLREPLFLSDRDRLWRVLDHLDGDKTDKQKLAVIRQVVEAGLHR